MRPFSSLLTPHSSLSSSSALSPESNGDVVTPLELLNLYYSDGQSTGNKENKLWRKMNALLSWENILERGYQADLAPLLYYIITKAIPRMSEISIRYNSIEKLNLKNAIPFLNARYQASLFKNMILLNELKRVTETLDENGILSIPLKGGYLAENVYDDIACRPMGDLDLLVQDCDKESAIRLLCSLGYKWIQDTPSSREMHETFIQKIAGQNVLIELHNRLVKTKFRKHFDLGKLFKLGYVPFDFQLLYYCWHTVRHGVSRFMWLCDLSELLRHRDARIDWEYLTGTATEYNVKQETCFVLCLTSSLLAPPMLKECPMKPGGFRRFILDKIFLNRKGELSGPNEARQRFIMSLVLMKPVDAVMLLSNCVARATAENRQSLPTIRTVQGGHK